MVAVDRSGHLVGLLPLAGDIPLHRSHLRNDSALSTYRAGESTPNTGTPRIPNASASENRRSRARCTVTPGGSISAQFLERQASTASHLLEPCDRLEFVTGHGLLGDVEVFRDI